MDEFSDQFDYNNGPATANLGATVSSPPRTWTGWLFSYIECSVSAMTVAWWISAAASPAIYRKVNVQFFFQFLGCHEYECDVLYCCVVLIVYLDCHPR